MLVRIRVLRGRIEAVSQALARRPEVPLIDLSASGDQLVAVVRPSGGAPGGVLLGELPLGDAVVSMDAQTVIHVFGDAAGWRAAQLTDDERRAPSPDDRAAGGGGERRALSPGDRHGAAAGAEGGAAELDEADAAIARVLAADGRRSAAAIARLTALPESTVRRRLAALLETGRLVTRVIVDPRRLGLAVDADLRMPVAPGQLDAAGQALAPGRARGAGHHRAGQPDRRGLAPRPRPPLPVHHPRPGRARHH
jgi:hypothetical protein